MRAECFVGIFNDETEKESFEIAANRQQSTIFLLSNVSPFTTIFSDKCATYTGWPTSFKSDIIEFFVAVMIGLSITNLILSTRKFCQIVTHRKCVEML